MGRTKCSHEPKAEKQAAIENQRPPATASGFIPGRADRLEPFQNFNRENAREIADSALLKEKQVLTWKSFGSNLVLDPQKIVVLAASR